MEKSINQFRRSALKTLAFLLFFIPMAAMAQTTPYIITGSGEAFTATKGGATVGTAGQPIQTVINAIRTDANGADCSIQFGDGDELDIGTGYITFNGSWGKITLSGKVTGASTDSYGTIYKNNTGSIESSADIKNTAAGGYAVRINSSGAVTISGGKISATTGSAVYISTQAKIIISGTADITSASTGTIYLQYSGGAANTVILEITGGTITNTATGNAVRNASIGTVNISGGTISATTGYAVYNGLTGAITISGGKISATTGSAVYNYPSAGTVTISGGEISATTGRAVENYIGKITVSGTANITSATTSATNGAIYNGSTGIIEIAGGEVKNTAGNYAVYCNNANGTVVLSGASVIAQRIRMAAAGKLSVDENFSPAAEQVYAIEHPSAAANDIAVIGGAAFMPNFTLANTGWFLMPSSSDIVLTNTYFTVTVTNGTGGGYYEEGTAVELSASTPPAGKYFHNWQITPEVTFLAGTAKTSEEIEFEMPAAAVTATAVYGDLPLGHYAIEVTTGGHGVANPSAAHAAQGTEITLTATPDEGYRLKEWQVVKGGVTIANNKFTMPAAEVEVKAVFEKDNTPTISARGQQPIGIHAAAGAITLTNLPSGARVEVYGLNGKQVYSGRALQSAPLRIAVPAKGVYIVRAGSQSLKAAVR